MPITAIIFGAILEALGMGGYIATGMKSVTALIPSFFGTIILLCGVFSLVKPTLRKHLMHAAAGLSALGFLGMLRIIPKIPSLINGTVEHPAAIWLQVAFGILCLVFVAICFQSFRAARRAKPEDYGIKTEIS